MRCTSQTLWMRTASRGLIIGLGACVLAAALSPTLSDNEIRARVAATRSRLRAMAIGLEAYMVDWRLPPYDGCNYQPASAYQDRYEFWCPPIDLTTPVSYCNPRQWVDPFRAANAPGGHWQFAQIRYICTEATWGSAYDQIETSAGVSTYLDDVELEWGAWRVEAVGPDGTYGPASSTRPPGTWQGISGYPDLPVPYDPTNGTNSLGDLIRSQRAPNGYLNIPNP